MVRQNTTQDTSGQHLNDGEESPEVRAKRSYSCIDSDKNGLDDEFDIEAAKEKQKQEEKLMQLS